MKSVGSDPGVFNIGETAAVFEEGGTGLAVSEERMMDKIKGRRWGSRDSTKALGRGLG